MFSMEKNNKLKPIALQTHFRTECLFENQTRTPQSILYYFLSRIFQKLIPVVKWDIALLLVKQCPLLN